ncbi:hypothetical protein [Erwinia rhapontici]|uniref:hypothetical protein n=1 Tax=Erwinia rhapontici TaxID=55212 RepID=UPI003BA10450
MARRSNNSAFHYNFIKSGAFGVFKSNNSLPIEFLMTSFGLDDLAHLSYARDINTELNFDYLIQRDIDEERARDEISEYLASSQGKLQKEIVFLPPILVAIVKVDEQDKLVDYYPTCNFAESKDDNGQLYEREWPGLLKIENYPLDNGRVLKVTCGAEEKILKIDFEQAKLRVNATKNSVAGARLVVIDGQHRLCALNYLKSNHRELVEEISVPICIVYSPLSCEENKCNESIPSIAEVLRNLFVDVNSTVERVSGHFLTLLSDQTLGSVICREFCKKSLELKEEFGLGLIEWNTKKHKESMEISREHTITSIGVINNALDECFKSKAGVKLLSIILGLSNSGKYFDFGDDEYEEKVQYPEYFPWRDFLSRHKNDLTELVNATITPAIYEMFFGNSSIYNNYILSFRSYFEKRSGYFKVDRSVDASIFESVKYHVLFNDPIDKPSRAMLNEVLMDVKSIREKELPEFSRKVIFQKALFELWVSVCAKFVHRNIGIDKIPLYINEFVVNCFKPTYDVFNSKHVYLQDTIFNGQKIKVTKVAKRQILRLILSQAIVPDLIRNLKVKHSITNDELDILSNLAKVEIGNYLQQMFNDKKKTFEKTYKTNFNLNSFDREELFSAEQKRSEDVKKLKENALLTSFDKLINHHTADDLKSSYEDLQLTIGFDDINYSFEYELEDEI